jgi:hypothetical protein
MTGKALSSSSLATSPGSMSYLQMKHLERASDDLASFAEAVKQTRPDDWRAVVGDFYRCVLSAVENGGGGALPQIEGCCEKTDAVCIERAKGVAAEFAAIRGVLKKDDKVADAKSAYVYLLRLLNGTAWWDTPIKFGVAAAGVVLLSTVLRGAFNYGQAAGLQKGFHEGHSRGYDQGNEEGKTQGRTDVRERLRVELEKEPGIFGPTRPRGGGFGPEQKERMFHFVNKLLLGTGAYEGQRAKGDLETVTPFSF